MWDKSLTQNMGSYMKNKISSDSFEIFITLSKCKRKLSMSFNLHFDIYHSNILPT